MINYGEECVALRQRVLGNIAESRVDREYDNEYWASAGFCKHRSILSYVNGMEVPSNIFSVSPQ